MFSLINTFSTQLNLHWRKNNWQKKLIFLLTIVTFGTNVYKLCVDEHIFLTKLNKELKMAAKIKNMALL